MAAPRILIQSQSQSQSEIESEFDEQGCGGCFRNFRLLFPSKKRDIDQVNLLSERERERERRDENWAVKQVNKLREVSELVAGPKWKNFIRKIGAYFNHNNKRRGFQYDSFNYTLNFDNGIGIYDDDQHGANLGFSSRFAPPAPNDHKPASST